MSRLIDADALYKKACDLEAQAIDYTVKISNDEEKRDEWLRWSAILAERTAFKYDVNSAPTIKPERKTGRWLPDNRPGGGFWVCSECKFPSEAFAANVLYKFCPNCGAYMEGEQNE